MGSYFDAEDGPRAFGEGFEETFTDNPIKEVVDTITQVPEGAILGTGKLFYETWNTGVWIGNTIIGADELAAQGLPTLDHTKEYWTSMEALANVEQPGFVKGVGDITAFGASTYSATAKLAAMTGFNALAKGSKVWHAAKQSLFIAGPAGVAMDLNLTRASDKRFSEHLNDAGVMPDWLSWMYDRNGESEFEGRVKNAIEGYAIGLGIDSGIEIFRVLKSSREMIRKISKTPQEVRDNIKTMVGDPDADEQIADFYRC